MPTSISTADLTEFLLAAKLATYASQNAEANVAPLLPGSRQLEYHHGNFHYRDIYFGSAFFAGQETVYHDQTPLWTMVYAGGMLTEPAAPEMASQVYEFLRLALRQVEPQRPFRGPRRLLQGSFLYEDESHGSFERFYGLETISQDSLPVYQLRYSGGLIG